MPNLELHWPRSFLIVEGGSHTSLLTVFISIVQCISPYNGISVNVGDFIYVDAINIFRCGVIPPLDGGGDHILKVAVISL